MLHVNVLQTIAKVATGPQGRNILWGSIALDLAPIPNYLIRSVPHAEGVMSLPKDVKAASDGMLSFSFVPELQVLRDGASAYRASNLLANTTFEISGLQLELLVSFGLRCGAANRSAFGLRFSGENCTVDVGYAPRRNELYTRRSSGGIGHQIAVPHTLVAGEALQMHVFLDGPILEVIANGRSPSEAQVWPVPTTMDVGAFGPCEVSNIAAWRLRSIHG
jgi:hypothetical protein